MVSVPLMLARYARRQQEFAVRAAVGSGPARLLRQLLTESVVIAALGGIGGLAVTAYALDLLVAIMPADVPRLARIAANERVLGFTARPPSRYSGRTSTSSLRRGGRRAGDTLGQQRLCRLLVAAEVALALVLLAGAGLLLQSFVRLVNVDSGVRPREHRDPAGSSTMPTTAPAPRRHSCPPRRRRRRRHLGVPARPRRHEPPDPARPAAAPARRGTLDDRVHDAGLTGRDAAPPPSRTLVRRPLGFRQPLRPELFLSTAQAPNGAMTYVVRTEGDPSASIPAIQNAVWDAAPDLAFFSVSTVDALLSRTLATRRFATTLLALFGVAALTLAGLGI